MRLILTQGSNEVGWIPRLRTRRGSTPYAILSHRWLDDENSEVLFADIAEIDESAIGPVRNSQYAGLDPSVKAGFAKVRGAALQALTDGYEYIWIDTCCINTESSAELSEAINSMFSWYGDSSVCYVYLADCESYDAEQGEGKFPFMASKWWRRGWTLQELLAPRDLLFFTSLWTEIGRKDCPSLAPVISQVSGIEINVLNGTISLEYVSVAQRMSWAAKRITSRTEDIAYALVGIFSVNMPLLYGEGERAFLRLQYEIMKDSDDETIFAWRNRAMISRNGENDGDQLEGMLAAHPSAFSESHNVIQLHSDEAGPPYTMTNSGLSISFPLEDKGHGLYVAWLRCLSLDDNKRVGIYLKKLTSGDRHYARVRSNECSCDKAQGPTRYTSIYVKQHHDQVPAYKELGVDRKVIRLIQILPTEDLLQMRLRLVDANFETAAYQALSYVWDIRGSAQTVTLNSQYVKIPEKVYKFLQTARKNTLYWIDVVCIQQADFREERHQVLLLSPIYRHATQVVVLLDGIHHGAGEDPPYPSPGALACALPPRNTKLLAHVAKHRYWECLWALQEFVMAREVTFHMDTCIFPVALLNDLLNSTATSTIACHSPSTDYLATFLLCRDSYRIGNTHLEHNFRITSEIGTHRINFESLLIHTQHLPCADPRDYVYAIINISDLGQDFPVDYEESAEDLYRRLINVRRERLTPDALSVLQALLLHPSRT